MPMLERRAAHVRPRRPSSDRLAHRPALSIEPVQDDLRVYRPLRKGPRFSLSTRIAVTAGLAVVCVFLLTAGVGLLVGFVEQLGTAIGDAVAKVASPPPATLAPSGVALDTPALDQPGNDGYTSQAALVLTGSVPGAVVGKDGYSVRIYLVGGDDSRTKVSETAVGATTRFVASEVTLSEGPNTFVAVLVGPSGEGNPSPPAVYILDTKPPRLSVTSPDPGILYERSSVDVVGTSEEGVTIAVRNRQAPGGALNSAVVGSKASFRLSVRLVAGNNTIDVTATDQAGNSKSVSLQIRRDYGQLAAHLSVSPSKIRAGATTTLTLTVHATSFNGSPLAGATVVFTLNVSGLDPMTSAEFTTNDMGVATWTQTISGSVAGTGYATVSMTSDTGDPASGWVALNTN
jgi:hypothetical protein